MADGHSKPNHDYHLVDPSPWPLVGSIFAFLLAVGAIAWMKNMPIFGVKMGGYLAGAGFIGILYVMAAWWADVIKEAEHGGYHTRVVQISHRYGMILFIASEVMFFVAWFWAFFDASLVKGLILTVLLGALFTGVQAFEYAHAPFGFKGSIYGATFFMATGFHGFHVLVGTIFLLVCLFRATAGHFTPTQHLGFEFAAWYWHFVDVVWLFLFSCIYVWASWGATIAHGH